MNNKSHHNRTSFARDENASPLSLELSEYTELLDDGRTRAPVDSIELPPHKGAVHPDCEIASSAQPGQLQLMRTFAPDEEKQLRALRILSESSSLVASERQDATHG